MPVENTLYIGGLDPNLPSPTDLHAEGDDHLRLIKRALKATFPNVNEPVTATAAQLNAGVPSGVIALWFGAVNTIPAGWALCNGVGTPDLRDRFIVGAGASYGVGATGGNIVASVFTTANGRHTHGASADAQGHHAHGGGTAPHALTWGQMPPHTHNVGAARIAAGVSNQGLYQPSGANVIHEDRQSDNAGSGDAHAHGIYGDGLHSHNIAIGEVGDHQHIVTIPDMRPPFYALCYIMKV